ncbi:MAG: GGDEF domain-containing protein [Clostridiales bacterium]|nr:GGDEF domain-containing protein [Clostridiales bacterium]
MKYSPEKVKLVKRSFFLSLFILFSVTSIILLSIENSLIKNELNAIKLQERIFVTVENQFFTDEFHMVISDLKYIAESFDIDNENLNENWKTISDSNKIYNKIRFIDKAGNEKINVQYQDNQAIVMQEDNLQNVDDETFFRRTLSMSRGQMFVAKLDLYSENGEIIQPYKPIMRFCTPVFNDQFDGIVVIDYDATELINKFRVNANNSNGEVHLINESGHWISHEDSEREWGHILNVNSRNKQYRFSVLYSDEWELMSTKGHVITDNGLFTYAEIDVGEKVKLYSDHTYENIEFEVGYWKIVTLIASDSEEFGYYIGNDFFIKIGRVIKKFYYFAFICIALAALITFIIFENKVNFDKLKITSDFDPLTKAYNRREGFTKIQDCIENINHYRSISLCFIDVNGLKEVNDVLGHASGDDLLLTVVDTIKNSIRDEDFLIRMGGDEFLIVFLKIKKEIAETIWQRIVKSYDSINSLEDREYFISVSHGIVEVKLSDNDHDLNDLITRADDKMYDEKRRIKKNINIIRRKMN